MTLLKASFGFFACYFLAFGLDVAATQIYEENMPWNFSDELDNYGSADYASGAFPIDDEHEDQDRDDLGDNLMTDYPMPPQTNQYYERGITCGDGTKIGQAKICNGYVDCYDCSDEENCPYDSHKIFMCYETGDVKPLRFTSDDQKCIVLSKFCDGKPDCKNGADEKQIGIGFRCNITDRFRECILPQRLICDDMAHCEDRSDMCPGIWSEEDFVGYENNETSLPENLRSTETPHTLFQCLDKKLFIRQKQVCDGNFDCYDLSDECVCDAHRSKLVQKVCNGLCAKAMWRNQPSNPNCELCEQGEVYWKSPLFLTDGRERNIIADESPCFSPNEIVEKVGLLLSAKTKSTVEETEYDVIECFSAKISDYVRARKCDGRPECMNGEDECGIGCYSAEDAAEEPSSISESGSGDYEYMDYNNFTDPEFCRLLTKDYREFACLSWLDENGSRKSQFDKPYSMVQIAICDGKQDCVDGSDEMFCPKRMPCYTSGSAQLYDDPVRSFDEAQRCDGHSHCLNGKDEDPFECITMASNRLPCGDGSPSKNAVSTFALQNYLDGKKHCDAGADECPPFFSKIFAVQDIIYGNESKERQIGISTHDAAIGSMALQIFVITISLVGASALVVSFALGLYDITVAWYRLCKSGAELTRRSYIIYVREVVVYIGITVSKGLLCGFFAYIRIQRSEESNYGMIDLKWRSSFACSISGTISLIGCQIPVLTLAVFVIAYLIFNSLCKKGKRNPVMTNRDGSLVEGFHKSGENKKRNGRRNHIAMIFASFILVIIIWLPVGTIALLLQTPSDLRFQTESYAWVKASGAPQIFQANLVSQDNAMGFVSKLMALSRNTTQRLSEMDLMAFSFANFPETVNNIFPRLGLQSLGTFGYFSQSGSCLPAFLVQVTGGEAPFDIAVSNLGSISLSILIIALNFALIFCTGVLSTRYGAGIAKICTPESARHERQYVLSRTISRLVAIETITWTVIALSYLLKSIDSKIATDRTYATICIVAVGTNCGILTPFVLLMRKFRGGDSTKHKQSRQRSSEEQRVIEVEKSNEKRHLTDQRDESCENEEPSPETRALMENISDE